ncbi:hypothetical protein ACMFMG_009235 [Clarireedia jacksonii]
MISRRYYHLSRQARSDLPPAGPHIGLNVHNFQDTTVDIVLLVLTTTFVGLRFYARRLQNVRYGSEDWTILAALVIFYAYIGVSFAAIFGGGIGYHASQLSLEQATLALQLTLAIQVTYAAGVGLVKCSICLLLMRIFSTKKFRIAATIVMGLCIAWATMTILIGFLICHPLDYNWNLKPPGSHCGNQTVAYGSVGVVDILTDTCILILPIPMIWRLQMPKLNKILLVSLLGFGVFTIVVTIVRVIIIVNTDFLDFSYSSKGIFIWTAVNFGTGILVACCPLLRPFFERFHPKSLIRSLGTSRSVNTSLTADSTSRRHSKFSRLGEDSFPLHERGNESDAAMTGFGDAAHEQNFLRAPGNIHNTVYSPSNNPNVASKGISVQTELIVDSTERLNV